MVVAKTEGEGEESPLLEATGCNVARVIEVWAAGAAVEEEAAAAGASGSAESEGGEAEEEAGGPEAEVATDSSTGVGISELSTATSWPPAVVARIIWEEADMEDEDVMAMSPTVAPGAEADCSSRVTLTQGIRVGVTVSSWGSCSCWVAAAVSSTAESWVDCKGVTKSATTISVFYVRGE